MVAPYCIISFLEFFERGLRHTCYVCVQGRMRGEQGFFPAKYVNPHRDITVSNVILHPTNILTWVVAYWYYVFRFHGKGIFLNMSNYDIWLIWYCRRKCCYRVKQVFSNNWVIQQDLRRTAIEFEAYLSEMSGLSTSLWEKCKWNMINEFHAENSYVQCSMLFYLWMT